MNGFPLLVFVLAAYGLVVWFILAVLAHCAEAGERFDQTITDHHHDKDQT